ncbi:hypothetical protein [Kribbella sp. NBC_00359]|uniref:hypothetical protein n=1 Tax=Kribbella sp. NBC_00359 TaxID=2975966 RepID=UPI002E1FDBF8
MVEFSLSAIGDRNATLVIQQNIPLPDCGTPLKLVGTGTGGSAQRHSLSVTIDTSTDEFRVVSTPPGIDCPERSMATFDDGTDVILQAVHDQRDGELDWDNCDTVSAFSCRLQLNADRSVRAHLSA